jgi:hypothetical protein
MLRLVKDKSGHNGKPTVLSSNDLEITTEVFHVKAHLSSKYQYVTVDDIS